MVGRTLRAVAGVAVLLALAVAGQVDTPGPPEPVGTSRPAPRPDPARCPGVRLLLERNPSSYLRAACALAQDPRAVRGEAARDGASATVVAEPGVGDPAALAELTAAILDHHRRFLDSDHVDRVDVYVVALPGPPRGRGGFSLVLLDAPEAKAPIGDCGTFLASAGVDSTCSEWVLAHEVAHQWLLPGDGSDTADTVVWESLADYLALRWWRDHYGHTAARDLVEDLLLGRMQLRWDDALVMAPAAGVDGVDDLVERAVLRGRGSMAWVAIEEQLGADRTQRLVRAVLGAGPQFAAEDVLQLVDTLEPAAAQVLQRWWWRPDLDPDDVTAALG